MNIPARSCPPRGIQVAGLMDTPKVRLTRKIQIAAAVLLLGATLAAQTQSAGLQRAYNFLQDKQNATDILNFVHFGATYRGHQFQRVESVVDGNGNRIDGDFALVYRFLWQDDGYTDVVFFCDRSGHIYESKIEKTNAQVSQPFAFADLSIQVIGRWLVNSDKNMSDSDRQLALKLIDKADAHGLLDLWLAMQ